MILKEATVQTLVVEELVHLLRGRKFKKQSLRETKRNILKTTLDKKQIEGTLEPLERIIWAAFRYDDYKLQVRHAKSNFNDLRHRAGNELREFMETLAVNPAAAKRN